MYKRAIYLTIMNRLKEKRRFIQVLAGPRQVGKTTLVHQVIKELNIPSFYASADDPTLQNTSWIEQQWSIARLKAEQSKNSYGTILILDEVQKIPAWSNIVKKLWDEDTRSHVPLKVILLGSSPLLMQKGLTESLAGRFELIHVTHWSYQEMHDAFGWNVEQFIFFGGYPGAANLISDEHRWAQYIRDSLIETSISRDILLMNRVDKPALLRRLFHLGCEYSGQILSFHKMLGQLQDAGNTTTLSHYLELLAGAGLLTGIPKFAGTIIRQRASSPKLQVLNTALMTALSQLNFIDAQEDHEFWGRLVESAVGAHLLNNSFGKGVEVFYWREDNEEVDFILRFRKTLVAFEVKSSPLKKGLSGMATFAKLYKPKHPLLIGGPGIPLKDFFMTPVEQWFGQ
jgi:uncharacterized protein